MPVPGEGVMTANWTKEPERGSLFLIRFIAWLAQALGRPITRLLLYPITFYFLLFNPKARRASKTYLARIFNRTVTWRDTFRHIWCFAATILDRTYFLTNRFEKFDIEIHNLDVMTRHLDAGRGCVLLGAHLGSFEAMRSLAVGQADLPLKILMYPENSNRINLVLNALNPQMAKRIISLGHAEAMLEVKEWLDNEGLIGILGDRIAQGEKVMPASFLGHTANFPQGPFILAAITGAPIVMFTALYRGGRRYDIHFEELCDTFRPPRAEREQAMAEYIQKYASQLEKWCADAPYNWFNFYDFWDQSNP